MVERVAVVRRARSFPAIATAFLAGILIAAVVIPASTDDDDTTSLSAKATSEASATDMVTEAGAAPTADTAEPATATAGESTDSSPVAAGSAPSGGAGAVAAPSATGGSVAASGPVNNGASGRGVTAKEITIGVIDLDTSDLTAVCPRCTNGPSGSGGAQKAMIAHFAKQGKIPVGGRTIKLSFFKVRALAPETAREACVQMAQTVKPFLVVVGPGTEAAGTCLASEFKIPVVHSAGGQYADEELLRQLGPLWTEIGAASGRYLRNFARWADRNGLVKGKTIGIYGPEDEAANRRYEPFRAELKRLGVKIEVDLRASGSQGVASSSDPVAVQRFRGANVDVAFLFASPSGFQKVANNQAYRPKYPVIDFASELTDAVADINSDANALDGNLGYRAKHWAFTSRKPVRFKDNPTAQECIDVYQAATGRSLDVFDNDAEVHYVTQACTNMYVLMQALQNAGGNLTLQSFVDGVRQIKGMPTPTYPSVTFGRRIDGADLAATYTHTKARHQPSNNYWYLTGGFEPMGD